MWRGYGREFLALRGIPGDTALSRREGNHSRLTVRGGSKDRLHARALDKLNIRESDSGAIVELGADPRASC